jgi:pyrroloquinoline quinone (PQQ) biosynthesis protein C
MRNFDHAHSIAISAQLLITAAPDGRCWLVDIASPGVIPLPFSKIAAERASLSAALVEGAVSAGLRETRSTPPAGPYTLPRYIRWLAGNYIFAGQTPGLFRRGAERFTEAGRLDLAEFARQKAEEETGHAELAYRDLQALGLPAADVVQLVRPPSASVFAERFRSCVESSDPISLFGFSYCLERMAVERDAAFVRNIEAICPPGVKASRFLKVHSNTGSDGEHVHEQLAVFESFDDAGLTAVVRAVYETAELLARQPSMDAMLSDDEICRRLGLNIGAQSPASDAGQHREAITEESQTLCGRDGVAPV